MNNKRVRIIELIRKLRESTISNGCTPAEAAAFASKAAEWVEKYQIEEAELRAGDDTTSAPEIDVQQKFIRTGKKVFNPGMTSVANALSVGMCCQCVLLHKEGEAVYGVIGDSLDSEYVCSIASSVVPALQVMAMLEGREHGYEKAGLIRWQNQYLMGAAKEIRQRLERDRKERSEIKETEHKLALASSADRTGRVESGKAASCTAIACVTGETIAVAKREATEQEFRRVYPKCKTTFSKSRYDHDATSRGREAGKKISLNRAIGE